ncbi:expressed unknown protein [Seminavis robusta]|uniref:Uncharacterized protein n=1 Tax=Seminavis robusta TaxID=568900 RepID=A0A9N8DNI5_9STRA|nr:expressed unknown protein [Seminavis robusta]|eukprot:Sro177_g077650.1 n/a (156) ;mRNA; r:20530-20997
MMKVVALLVAFLATASAFAPMTPTNAPTKSSTAVYSLFDSITGMDLFAPKKDQNKYGARTGKNLKIGTIGSGSYVPDGLTQAQYNKIRAEAASKKEANYQRNVAKAGKFEDFTEFYKQRGTSEGGSWLKAAGRGHKYVKTKYDWSGEKKDTATFW